MDLSPDAFQIQAWFEKVLKICCGLELLFIGFTEKSFCFYKLLKVLTYGYISPLHILIILYVKIF